MKHSVQYFFTTFHHHNVVLYLEYKVILQYANPKCLQYDFEFKVLLEISQHVFRASNKARFYSKL